MHITADEFSYFNIANSAKSTSHENVNSLYLKLFYEQIAYFSELNCYGVNMHHN